MSARIAAGKPRHQSLDWSDAAYPSYAARIQERFAAYSGHIDGRDLRTMLSHAVGYLYVSFDRLSDGYNPFAICFYKTQLGKVAVVIPRCNDETFEDGVNTDRAVTLHTLGTVREDDVRTLCSSILDALPAPAVGALIPLPDIDDLEQIAGHA